MTIWRLDSRIGCFFSCKYLSSIVRTLENLKSNSSVPENARSRKPSILHIGFEAAILLKGLHAAFEILGGILLAFLKPETLVNWIRLLTQNELSEDPQDLVANLLVRMGSHYSINSQHFGVFYLVSHGILNLGIVLLLWRGKLWAYPLGIAILFLFIAYQCVRWMSTHSTALIAFTAIDAIVIWLTWSEYWRLLRERPTPKQQD